MSKIADKVAKKLKKGSAEKIISLSDYRKIKSECKEEANNLTKTKDLIKDGYDPQLASYMSCFNLFSFVAEMLCELPELHKYDKIIEIAQNEYMPSWPPMSPISRSFYGSWLLFDLKVGIGKETLASCMYELKHILKFDDISCRLLYLLHQSRAGLYKFIEEYEDKIILREIFTQQDYLCHIPSKFKFEKGDLWLTRILPPIYDFLNYHVVFTSPYIITGYTEEDWMRFFERKIPGIRNTEKTNMNYHGFMKYGLSNYYWLEYIMQSYTGHTDLAIILTGMPDLSNTRPHFSDNKILI